MGVAATSATVEDSLASATAVSTVDAGASLVAGSAVFCSVEASAAGGSLGRIRVSRTDRSLVFSAVSESSHAGRPTGLVASASELASAVANEGVSSGRMVVAGLAIADVSVGRVGVSTGLL